MWVLCAVYVLVALTHATTHSPTIQPTVNQIQFDVYLSGDCTAPQDQGESTVLFSPGTCTGFGVGTYTSDDSCSNGVQLYQNSTSCINATVAGPPCLKHHSLGYVFIACCISQLNSNGSCPIPTPAPTPLPTPCLLYTSDAADE